MTIGAESEVLSFDEALRALKELQAEGPTLREIRVGPRGHELLLGALGAETDWRDEAIAANRALGTVPVIVHPTWGSIILLVPHDGSPILLGPS